MQCTLSFADISQSFFPAYLSGKLMEIFLIAGVIMLSTSLILSARMGIYQEQIYSKYGSHHREALFFTVSKKWSFCKSIFLL